jgi:hypothetical protein
MDSESAMHFPGIQWPHHLAIEQGRSAIIGILA